MLNKEQKNATIFLYTKSGTKSKKKTTICVQMKDMKLNFLRTYS